MSVLRRPRGSNAAGDAARRRGPVAGACRPEPLPGLRAAGGRRAHASPCTLARGARRRRACRSSPKAWRLRREAVPGGYLHALVNEGREAGSSLPHTHSQLVWLPGAAAGDAVSGRPRALERRRRARRARPRLPVRQPAALRARHRAGGAARGRVRATSCFPPRSATGRGDPPCPPGGRRSTAQCVAPRLGDWHFELLPRLSILAGVELGAGWWINALAPEDAAAALRERAPDMRRSRPAPRGSAGRPRSPRRGSGPCPSPA